MFRILKFNCCVPPCFKDIYCVLLLVLIMKFNDGSYLNPDQFATDCSVWCPLQNVTTNEHVECNSKCKYDQYLRGCELWKTGLWYNCQSVCNGTQELVPYRELYCVIGCNDAIGRYFQKLKEKIGTPPAPSLVADTLTATSLCLKWEEEKLPNITYSVQWKYEQVDAAWQYCKNQSWGPENMIRIDNLQPYTKYRFRIVLLLRHYNAPIASEPSMMISTLPGSIPSSPPLIVRATPTDPTRVSLSWQPGPFPNGPILSYVLQINELPNGYAALKDIPVSENKDFYMFENLAPSRNYTISIAMRNAFGLGPLATTVLCTPAMSNAIKENDALFLILGSHHTVESSQAVDMFEDPTVMYETKYFIQGVALHVRHEMLFVSDSSGSVFMTSATQYTQPHEVLPPGPARPLDLSVDWLNDQLYILQEVTHSSGSTLYQVARCSLNGSDLTVAIAGFVIKPHHIEVDPYNGYLFWVVKGAGLFRLDLVDISNGVKHEVKPALILENANLGAFTVDYTNFRLIVPLHSLNTVIAVPLDGHETTNLRSNTQRPQFQEVKSLTMANGLFYWTNGEKVLTEEYHPGQKSYFHNGFKESLQNQVFVAIMVNAPSSQPIPVPVNPPIMVQAVLSPKLAKISWQPPHLLGGQGKGAWQGWSYNLLIKSESTQELIKKVDLNATQYMVTNLESGTEYSIKVAAVTSSGQGPWSSEFKGRTLTRSASILWSAAEGLLVSDATGDNVKTLIPKENLKDGQKNYHIVDIAWYRDQIFFVSNTSFIFHYNLTSNVGGKLRGIDSVGSIAVDWIGKRLYWSNLNQQLLTRGEFDGSLQEPLPILTIAKELNIDAVGGHIYWSTGHAVESSRLNGKQRHSYYPAEPFSGKQVMGLTLDTEERSVYWIVRSYEGSSLFKASMADSLLESEIIPVRVATLQASNLQGPLCYLDGHLLWLQDAKRAVVGDKNGQNTAIISDMTLSGLNTLNVLDSFLHTSPDGYDLDSIYVIPDSVDRSSIRVEGTYQLFNLTWNPVTNVNYGEVMYEIKIKHLEKDIVKERSDVYLLCEGAHPYAPLSVTIRAFTFWGTSMPTHTIIHSPPSAPSLPTNPRIFVEYVQSPSQKLKNIKTTFRWSPPLFPNGILTSYKVSFSHLSDEKNNTVNNDVPVNVFEYFTYDIPYNSSAQFQVSACTKAGCSDFTPPVFTNTTLRTPVPKLLFFSSEAFMSLDFDSLNINTLFLTSSPIIDFAANFFENKVYWIDYNKILWSSHLNSLLRTKLALLNGTGQAIAVDWIGRIIFWSENNTEQSNIFSLNLNNGVISFLFSRPTPITCLQVAPFQSLLLWIEEDENKKRGLMSSNYSGSNLQQFFSSFSSRKRRNPCNCPKNSLISRVISVEHVENHDPRVLWYDERHNTIWSTDLNGCPCDSLVNSIKTQDIGLPLTSITSDYKYLYWSSHNQQVIYSALKVKEDELMANSSQFISNFSSVEIYKIIALGSHLQPYPSYECLIPRKMPAAVNLLNKTAFSITLEIPRIDEDESCSKVSTPLHQYTIYYGPIKDDGASICAIKLESCLNITTFETLVTIKDLNAFSRYVFRVAVQTYFSNLDEVDPVLGPLAVFQTAAGAPPPPENLKAVSLGPTSVLVEWTYSPRIKFSNVWYQILWTTEESRDGGRRKGELSVLSEYSPSNKISTVLTKLLPGLNYYIKVRAYSQNNSEINSESSTVVVSTYPEPQNITLNSATPYSLNVSWLGENNIQFLDYKLQYFNLPATEWVTVPEEPKSSYHILHGLLPRTHYTFRLAITFSKSTPVFIWPSDSRFTFLTLGDKPSTPGVPLIQFLVGGVYKISWDPSRDNGGAIELYCLEGKMIHRERLFKEKRETENLLNGPHPLPNDWSLFYNGTENYWFFRDLSSNFNYLFRVRSRNLYGWSDYSRVSDTFDMNAKYESVMNDKRSGGIPIWICILISVFVAFIFIFCIVCTFQNNGKEKKNLLDNRNLASNRVGGSDAELATLRELPRHPNFIENTNALYTTSNDYFFNNEELSLLPHIRRDQITLTKFLGSGAFGEVFEGKAKNVCISAEETNIETKVAIKTLRKSASEHEKTEFLKEALLMRNFKHTHILPLLGVCLDNDPAFIIMELMEGGDLLSYLRANRPLLNTNSSLTLADLIIMSLDVVKGCCYLEEMHFVHRDLACRNCLVSSHDPRHRIVKIGDFGLARDIYKNDYYRKEGDGLLPVRWMAPESLVDGVFTSQSDVWAFGVLVWEILTLGQRPYPARTNLEVLHFVRTGGRLCKPRNAGEELYELMLRCWSFSPQDRPTFKYCLEVLESIKQNCSAVPLVSDVDDYLSIERLDKSDKPKNGEIQRRVSMRDTSSPSRKSLENLGGPRYLELMYEKTNSSCTDYEEPKNIDNHIQLQDSKLNSLSLSNNVPSSPSNVYNSDYLLCNGIVNKKKLNETESTNLNGDYICNNNISSSSEYITECKLQSSRDSSKSVIDRLISKSFDNISPAVELR